ncbi:MAG: phosphate signaling complex protein PhoU [Gammaproteobacteria bacterium]
MGNKEHTSRIFDGELHNLHCLVLEMAGLVIHQLDQSLKALHDRDPSLAEKVITRDREVDDHEIKIDAAALTILAKRSPVANDLRKVVSVSKMVVDLELIGDEIVKIAKLTLTLFDQDSTDPSHQLLRDIIKMGEIIADMLKRVILAFDTCSLSDAHEIQDKNWDYGEEFQAGIRRQLTFVIENPRIISRSLNIFQIMKSLERCGDRCRNINEYLVFMLEGKNIRHHNAE